MTAPIALQLYSVREALAHDFEGVVRQIAGIGYAGVETAGFPGTTAQAAADLFRSLGLAVAGIHSALPLGDQQNEVLDVAATLGCTTLVCPWLAPEKYFQTIDGIKSACDLLNDAHAVAQEHGLSLCYHNHHFEYLTVEGRPVYQVMLEHLDPGILFEVDTYWVQVGGHDPAQVVKELGSRATLLHIKDGPAVLGEPMVAVGDGVINVPAIVQAGKGATEWLIVELDSCATDMLEAVDKSYQYMITNGLAHGTKA